MIYEQLKTLEHRLLDAAGDTWLDIQTWHFDRKDAPDREAKIEHLTACEQILFDAAEKVKTALEVVEIVDQIQLDELKEAQAS